MLFGFFCDLFFVLICHIFIVGGTFGIFVVVVGIILSIYLLSSMLSLS